MRTTLVTPRVGLATTHVPMPQTVMVQVPQGTDYIPSGGTFQQRAAAQFGRQNVRVPGDSLVPHAPRFRMVDIRMQGLGGVARAIGSMLGAKDPNCVNLNAWQGMTPAERIAHHVSSDEMQKIADKYHCIATR